ncbi:MAG: hypothetical protein KAY24_18430 [Candidatus Eisenbacteria sp.]|nr:hypothetical protein [Candidatus Eisenbacteria bacterium]
MKRGFLIVALVFVVGSACADPSDLEGGVFIAHYPAALQFSSDPPPEGWCQHYLDNFAIRNCEAQVNRIDTEEGVIWFVLAAWSGDKEWCGTEFGLGNYEENIFLICDHGACYPEEGLEIPTDNWPGPNKGTAFVVTGPPWTGNFVAVYYFAGYAYGEGIIPLDVDPTWEMAGTGNCASPSEVWSAAALGGMGLFTDGIYVCPEEGPGGGGGFAPGGQEEAVCCIEESCRITTAEECEWEGGEFHPEFVSCDSNPCGFSPLGQNICTVPSPEYLTIQDAVDDPACDIVELRDRVFTGFGNRDIAVPDRALTIRSQSDNPEACVINCGGHPEAEHQGFLFSSHEGADQRRLQGVTITHAYFC